MSKKKKMALAIVSIVCAISIGIGGTLMLFTDTTDIATNVVTFATNPVRIRLQETGWSDMEPDKVSDWVNHTGTDYTDGENDIDGDHYWEYTVPKLNFGQPADNDEEEQHLGYQDINTSEGTVDDPRTGPVDDDILPFYGIEYPNNLTPNKSVVKAPRVVHIDGVDTYVRVLVKLKVYEYSANQENELAWKPMTDAQLEQLLKKNFTVASDYTPTLSTDNVNNNDLEKYYTAYDDAGTKIEYRTFADFIKALKITDNPYNWKFVSGSDANNEPTLIYSYYYYINDAENQASLSPLYDSNAPAETSYYLDLPYKTDTYPGDVEYGTVGGETAPLLAKLSGDNHATAPIFTAVTIPNFTNAMQEILKNYKITYQFEAQAVQVDGNNPDSKLYKDYFKELEQTPLKQGDWQPIVSGNDYHELQPSGNPENYDGTPARDYPYPTATDYYGTASTTTSVNP
ncbi:MAG: hypothetical protein LBU32_00340 [Clostridiales bacterium]|nr:hypothetical protein [Clostridiales bacterium]